MPTLQLYMPEMNRRLVLERHDFYVAQVTARVLSQFSDLEGEADKFAESEYHRMGQIAAPDADPGDYAEAALDRGHGHYFQLLELRKQMLLGALAGCYHQWDKELREHVERELLHYMAQKEADKYAWDLNIGNVFDVLAEFGLDCRALPFFNDIDACRLIVNVYKHGKGRSVTELQSRYPQYLPDPIRGTRSGSNVDFVDHDWLEISQPQFVAIAASMRQFWEQMPERLYLTIPAKLP